LLHAARAGDLAVPVLSATLPSNDIQIRRGVDAVLATRKRRIGIVGLTFKAGTDDLRESPMVVLVESLIGKGCDVRILDQNVSIARLMGTNRQYIEKEIPHIAALMCDNVEALLSHAEVLVVSKADEEAKRAAAAASSDHLVVDLTRGAVWQPMGQDMETRS
jgi:GDP-mannose 6-dehydrogenase